jgi:glycerol-3-phosphate acyltransferase PlsY
MELLSLPLLCVLAAIIGYGLGSIPFGLVLTKLVQGQDVRAQGSGSIGATNVLRVGGKKLAALTLLLDAGKGALAVAVILWLGGDQDFSYFVDGGMMVIFPWPMMIVGLSVLLGHCYPIWLKFKGGKGVATAFGAALMMHPFVALSSILIWIIVAAVYKISSLAAIMTVIIAPIFAYFLSVPQSDFGGGSSLFAWFYVVYYILSAGIILWRHKANISRLIARQEPKIGQK